MLSPQDQLLAQKAVDCKRSGNRNEDAGIAPEIVTADIDFPRAAEWQVDAEAGDDEEHYDGGSAEDNGAPGVTDGVPEADAGIVVAEERNHLEMADSNPERKDEAQGIKDGEVSEPRERAGGF